MKPLIRWRARLWPIAVLAAIAVAACSGAADDVAPAGSAQAAEPMAASQAAEPGPGFPLAVTDSGGHEITFTAAPVRIISYSPGSTEMLFAVGAGDQVIAVDRFSDFPAATADLTTLEYSDPDPEAALALRPDLVIMATRQQEQVAQYRDLGMRVLFVREADSVDGVLETIAQLGAITGHAEEAGALVRDLTARIDAVTARLADVATGPRVFYEITADLYTAAPSTFIGGMLSLLKAQNIAAGAETQFPQLSSEAVVAADPEVILLSDGQFGESLETVRDRPGWSGLSAVVNQRVYPIDSNIVDRPGPRIVEGLETMARLLYPDRFGQE